MVPLCAVRQRITDLQTEKRPRRRGARGQLRPALGDRRHYRPARPRSSGTCSHRCRHCRQRGAFGGRRELRKVDKLSCVRFGSARCSVPNRLLGSTVEVLASSDRITILAPATGEVLAKQALMAPGEASVLDAHYGRPAATDQSSSPGDTEKRCRAGVLRPRASRRVLAASASSLRPFCATTDLRRGRLRAAGQHRQPAAVPLPRRRLRRPQPRDRQPLALRGVGPLPARAQHRRQPARPTPAPQQHRLHRRRELPHARRPKPVRRKRLEPLSHHPQ